MRTRLPRYAAIGAVVTSTAALVPSFSACTADEGPRRGGLVVTVANDGSLDTDLLKVKVSTGADNVLLQNEFRIPETTLPNQLSIVSNGSPTTTATIVISAWKNGVPVDRRDAIVTQIPNDRTASLVLTLSARCTPLVVLAPSGNAESLCAAGQTCDPTQGACGDATYDASSLPDYEGDECADGTCITLDAAGGDDDSAPTCPGSERACSGVCVPVATDKDNCGRCGHTCQGGLCSDGQCQPIALASRAADAGTLALAVDETDVYFSESTGIFKMPSNGGAVGQIADSGAVQISLSPTKVYWLTSTTGSFVYTKPKAGGAQGPFENGAVNVSSIAADETFVYVSRTSPSAVYERDYDGGTRLIPMDGGRLAYDDTFLFGVNAAGIERGYLSGQTQAGGAQYVSFSGVTAQATAPAVRNGELFWGQSDDGGPASGVIKKTKTDGGYFTGAATATQLAIGQTSPLAIAVDAVNVYWIGQNSPNLMTVPIAGGTPRAIVTNLLAPIALAIDANSVYWIDTVAGGGTRIMKVAKP